MVRGRERFETGIRKHWSLKLHPVLLQAAVLLDGRKKVHEAFLLYADHYWQTTLHAS